jgi:phosphoribosyl 1,2-cyclic phosphate phosphodiesterase
LTEPSRSHAARITFLGTGTSHGVPMIACECAVCRSTDPKDKRLRTSIYVDVPDRQRILVDTSPDLRQQALAHRINRVDAVIYTHSHADHILGLDELRRFNAVQEGLAVQCYATEATWDHIRKTFHYVFDTTPRLGGGIPQLSAHRIDGPLLLGGVRVVPIPLWHGRMPVLGFRFGRFAYLTDCNRLDDAAWPLLDGVDTLVVDALRERSHPTHFTVAEAVGVIEKVGPRRGFLTHMTHDLGHAATSAKLPAGVELAYDGLVLDVDVDVE